MKKKKRLTGSILFSKGLLESSTAPQFKGSKNSFLFCRLYDLALTIIMTTGKTVALTTQTLWAE